MCPSLANAYQSAKSRLRFKKSWPQIYLLDKNAVTIGRDPVKLRAIVKASELNNLLASLGTDPDVVTGDEWLPEQLIAAHVTGDLLFLKFDNAPQDSEGEEEGRGFVEHEVKMIRRRFEQILDEHSDTKSKADAMLALFLMGHELSSSEVIEILEEPTIPTYISQGR
ncbi:hypothetical protein SAMN04488136_108136 [Vibrio xiamenensis]|uniref:Uncharacterized protein n=1 Tax=Vibrio xiamenensis TaxID=861298 RepID=A0A1G7ZRP9_9VIBR|nr:hypothetical protein SAMN04488136_108136 [Vibrio xiamenensis]